MSSRRPTEPTQIPLARAMAVNRHVPSCRHYLIFSTGTSLLLNTVLFSSLLQEGVKTENDHINLKVAGQDGSVVQFKIKRHTPLSKLMKAYCERQVSCLFVFF